MKKIYFLLSLAPLPLFAQNTQGKVTYEERIKFELDLKLDGVENPEAIRSMLPKEQVSKKMLLFSPDASLYKNLEADEADNTVDEASEGGMKIRMMITRPQEEIYRDLKNDKVTEMHDLFGKSFLVNVNAEKAPWKLLNEQKTILGYPCMKAIIKDSTSTTEAWYAPSIPVASGPGAFAQLPGMILEVSTNNGKTTLRAVDIKPGDPGTISAPKKGKAVTSEEFRKISEQKLKEMQESMGAGGSGKVIIRRNN